MEQGGVALSIVSHEDEPQAYAETRRKNENGADEIYYDTNSNDGESSDTIRKGFSIHCIRETCGRIVNNEKVQLFIVGLISINAIMMGIGTYDFVTDNPELNSSFKNTDLAFLIIFTIELGMQFIYRGFNLFLDGWLVFDFFIVVLSWAFASMQVIRAFRIFRALRLITHIKDLRDLVIALLSVMPRMTAIMALLGLIFYIFAVMFTTLFKNLYRDGFTEVDYFGRLDATFYTLFQMMTLDWAEVARACMEVYSWAWAPFVSFICVSSFIVFNLIIAVICDAVAILHRKEEEHCIVDDPDVQKGMYEISSDLTRLTENQNKILNSLETLARFLAESQLKEDPAFTSPGRSKSGRSVTMIGVKRIGSGSSVVPPSIRRPPGSSVMSTVSSISN